MGKPWATLAILATQITVFTAAWLADGPQGWFPGVELERAIAWGANASPWTMDGGWWRLVANKFIYYEVITLALSAWLFLGLGGLIERRLGALPLALVFFGSAIAASLATLAFNPPNLVSAGAGATILAAFGAFIGRAMALRDVSVLRELRAVRWRAVLYFAWLGVHALVGGIDFSSFSVGLLTGILLGLILESARQWPQALITLVLVWGALATQLKEPPYRASDAEGVLAELDRLQVRNAQVRANLRRLAEEIEKGGAPSAKVAAQLDAEIAALKEVRADVDRIPSAPHTAGADFTPNVRRHLDERISTLEAASKGLRSDEDSKKTRQNAREAALVGNRNPRNVAVSSD